MFWAIVIISIAGFSIVSWVRKRGRQANPLTTIKYDGSLGFKIGDRKDFVVSRIKHLKLTDKEDQDEVSMYFKAMSPFITAASGVFNNVEYITFHFNKQDILISLLINLKAEQCDVESLGRILIERLSKVLGEPHNRWPKYVLWESESRIVHLERDEGFYVCISDSNIK